MVQESVTSKWSVRIHPRSVTCLCCATFPRILCFSSGTAVEKPEKWEPFVDKVAAWVFYFGGICGALCGTVTNPRCVSWAVTLNVVQCPGSKNNTLWTSLYPLGLFFSPLHSGSVVITPSLLTQQYSRSSSHWHASWFLHFLPALSFFNCWVTVPFLFLLSSFFRIPLSLNCIIPCFSLYFQICLCLDLAWGDVQL